VGVRVGVNEVALQRRIKQIGGKWKPVARVWEMPYSQAMALGREDQIEKRRISISRHLNRQYQGLWCRLSLRSRIEGGRCLCQAMRKSPRVLGVDVR
jgi:hypothetical protein